MSKVHIALGSNLENPIKNVQVAINDISFIPNSTVVKVSSFYETLPYGIINQPNFINVVILLQTNLIPEELLYNTQNIEKKYNRKKIEKWGPRILDIDILLFDNLLLNSSRLIIPHYDLENRSFFIIPLIEITPNICFPNGELMIEKSKKFNLNKDNLRKICL